ncbi:MAG: KpsF/GutQ family sugar-phosphate isomerase [Elusimicrobia bacterium]|nr:KpsF/GutQ family sugar-phosphate isomerase [Elusimicrobiota bacterium]
MKPNGPILVRAQKTLMIEAAAVHDQIKHLDRGFVTGVELIAACRGRTVVMGLGKSGIVGRKIASTMSSVGIPAVFLHPSESLHGDIGMLMPADVVILLSYTGETAEIKKVIPMIKRMEISVIVMTGRPAARVWCDADAVVNTRINKEACPYNLAPTASTTAMLAMGDALALCASEQKGFKKEHFAQFHPSGGLGKRLTLRVGSLMRHGKDNPMVSDTATVNEALLVMTKTRLGATSVVNTAGKLVGFFTDGDLRRKLQDDPQLLGRPMTAVMTKNPRTITDDLLAVEAAKILKKHKCDNIPVVNKQGKPIGIVDEQDLMSEGVV